ncbi:MAG TPA: forespore capture DNA-binding protein RefZ [Bacillus sp. (in: firmicutes)]|uniref:forespore capture DNA-binding protein RefZ n=1 Tax=Bacillus litorisediminis TaxID=2922713 RepID=UPI001FABF0DE|nr:forespore capture DNA-binding protein RefZ [Bacillus litorisediminis]HWO75466.1 forespore capture DNA-binding protein RefZ [Bacillus sp. (in: firmicutes)]
MSYATHKKTEILDSALYLFHTKGYAGTSLRDIATKANVNVAHISYYFHNKQGLLEHCIAMFFEPYLNEIEKAVRELEHKDPRTVLNELIKRLLKFQCKNLSLTRFVWRELSIDSQVVREILSTYLMKERFLLKTIFDAGNRKRVFVKRPVEYMVVQLKAMITMPFLNAQYMAEIWQIYPQDTYFANRYAKEIIEWFNQYLFITEEQAMIVN